MTNTVNADIEKTEVKAMDVKPEAVKNVEKASEDKKPVEKKDTVKSEVKNDATQTVKEKKSAAKKERPKKKPAVKVTQTLEYENQSYNLDDISKKLKDAHPNAEHIDIYVKPEDQMVYYVIDGQTGGMPL